MFHAQVCASQLLLQACRCWPLSEQNKLLRRAANRHIQKVADDTSTIRNSASSVASHADSSSCSRQSSIGDKEFEFDNTVMRALAYQRIYKNQYSKLTTQSSANSRSYTVTDEVYASSALSPHTPSFSNSVEHSYRAGHFAPAVGPPFHVHSSLVRSRGGPFGSARNTWSTKVGPNFLASRSGR